MSLKKQLKFKLDLNFVLFWGFYFLSKTLLKFSLRHVSTTNWHKQKQNSNSCFALWRFNFIFGKLCLKWSHLFSLCLLQFHFGFFSEFQLGICFEMFFFWTNPFLDCIFWSPIWKVFGSKLTKVHFGFCFWLQTGFGFYFRVQTRFGFSFCVQIRFGLNVLSSNTFCIFWGAQVQIHFGFCLWVQFHLGFFQSSKKNFGISVLSF